MHNQRISVIVPIYNVEPYLKTCLDSILAQTHQNLEIILVDDGSPDNCGAICDEYALLDSRIKVIHKSNGGLSDARNAGMEIMTGAYVAFVDSDDWIEPKMYQRLLELLIQFNADIAFGGVADDVLENGTVTTIKTSYYGQTPFVEGKLAAMRRYFLSSWAAWDKLYRVELFKNIRFPVGEINEDEAIVLHLLDRCQRVCYTNEVFYHYRKRLDGTSITTTNFSEKKLAWVKHCNDNLKYIQEQHPELETEAAARYRSSLLYSLTEIALSTGDYQQYISPLRLELQRNFSTFWKVSSTIRSDKLRLILLTVLPFSWYRKILRWRYKK